MNTTNKTTRDEKNRRIAEALGYVRCQPPNEDFWFAPGVIYEETAFNAEPIPDFYLSEKANALVLEAMPHPELTKRNDGIWWCIADYYYPCSLQYRNTDRKTVICEAFLAMLEEK